MEGALGDGPARPVSVVCVLDAYTVDPSAMRHAVDLAQQHHATLSLLTVRAICSWRRIIEAYEWIDYEHMETMRQRAVRLALEAVPPDLPVSVLHSRQGLRRALGGGTGLGSDAMLVVGCELPALPWQRNRLIRKLSRHWMSVVHRPGLRAQATYQWVSAGSHPAAA